jgi:CDP-diacylglycerol--glycerol-3-phosphate 3-phosphatidyltransferase
MGAYAVKPRFRATLRGVEHLAVLRGVSADQITATGCACVLAAAAAVLAATLNPLWVIAAASLVILRLACNALDGMVATDTNTARPLGQVYNEFADRIGDVAVLIAVTVRADLVWLGLAAIALTLLSSHMGTLAASAGGTRQYIGVMGKADRMILLALAAVVALFLDQSQVFSVYLTVVAVGCLLTLFQRARAVRRELIGLTPR